MKHFVCVSMCVCMCLAAGWMKWNEWMNALARIFGSMYCAHRWCEEISKEQQLWNYNSIKHLMCLKALCSTPRWWELMMMMIMIALKSRYKQHTHSTLLFSFRSFVHLVWTRLFSYELPLFVSMKPFIAHNGGIPFLAFINHTHRKRINSLEIFKCSIFR